MPRNTTPLHPSDRLLRAIEAKQTPVCVGIDPVFEKLPDIVRYELNEQADAESVVAAIEDYCFEVIEAVSPFVPCIKFQSACFERYGYHGWITLQTLIQNAPNDLQIILDSKRGDIGISAEHYAAAAFQGFEPDWLTINSYLGDDGLTPFVKQSGHGAFALVRTSNPGGDAIQNLKLADGRTVAEAVAQIIATTGSSYLGERGYSALGAVVGATKRDDAARLRELMPQQMLLVPGYGAQGGGVDDVLPCFHTGGAGAIVTASRSVIYAFKPNDPKWMNAVADAAAKFADEVGNAVGLR